MGTVGNQFSVWEKRSANEYGVLGFVHYSDTNSDTYGITPKYILEKDIFRLS